VSLADRFERRLEGLVGGAFARVFKGQVEPVEIGQALQREAADRKSVVGAGQVMCPNRYRVTLSSFDYERLAPWEAQLTQSLAELVQDYLDENRWTSVGDVEVYLAYDEQLHTGIFGVASRMDAAAPPRRRPYDSLSMMAVPGTGAPAGNVGAPPLGAAAPPRMDRAPAQPLPPPPAQSYSAVLLVDQTDEQIALRIGSNVVGRGTGVDLQLLDQGVSRRHLDVQFDGYRATLYDLGSTNGTTVNGHTVGSHVLRHGDVLRLGHTKLVFQQMPG
jgi:hypothetical protein